jgi:hypothetical protein
MRVMEYPKSMPNQIPDICACVGTLLTGMIMMAYLSDIATEVSHVHANTLCNILFHINAIDVWPLGVILWFIFLAFATRASIIE